MAAFCAGPHLPSIRRARVATCVRASAPRPTHNWGALSRAARARVAHAAPRGVQALRAEVDACPENPFLWCALSTRLSRDGGDVEAALAVLKEGVRCVPQGLRGGLFCEWGGLELRRGRLAEARSVFETGIENDAFGPMYVALVGLLLRERRVEEARRVCARGIADMPGFRGAPLLRTWAVLESRFGTPADALDKWVRATEADPHESRAWRQRAQYERECGGSVNAVAEVLYRGLAACNNDPEIRLDLARIEEKRKGPGVARALLSHGPVLGNMFVLRALAKLEWRESNIDRARKLFRAAADAEGQIMSIDPRRRKNERPRNAESFRQSDGRSKRTVKSLHLWALMEVRAGNVLAARDILDEARNLAPHDAGVWRALGELESRQKNYDQARVAFQRAVAANPQDPRILLAWGKTEAMAGDLSKAEDLIQRVVKMNPSAVKRLDLPSSVNNIAPVSTKVAEKDLFSVDADHASPLRDVDEDEGHLAPAAYRKPGSFLAACTLADALREWALLALRDGRSEACVQMLSRAAETDPNYATGWRLLGAQLLRLRGIDAVRATYERGLELTNRSTHPKLLHWWAQEERSVGNLDAARKLLRRATCASPEYMSAWLSWGLLEKTVGNLEQACEIFAEATECAARSDIRAPYIFQAWGRVEEIDRGRPHSAVEIFKRAVRVVPRSGSLMATWALLEERMGHIEHARELFQRAAAAEPSIGSVWHSWALLEAHRCNYERASDLFRQGIINDPSNAALLSSWAMMEGRELSNVARGRELFEKATAVDPLHGPAWHSWGSMEVAAGNLPRARELYLQAAKLRPEDPVPWHALGALEADHCNDYSAAISHWKRALDVSPGHALSYQSWALVEARARQSLGEARRIFQLGIDHPGRSEPEAALLYHAWATMEQKHRNLPEARKLLRKGLDADRRRAETWLSLALLEKACGNRDGARQLLKDAVESASPASSTGSLYTAWGRLEAEAGDLEVARELFAKAVSANPSHAPIWKAYATMEAVHGSQARCNEIRSTMSSILDCTEDANERFSPLLE